MNKLIKENWKEISKVLIAIIVVSIVTVYVSQLLKTDNVKEYIEKIGLFGPLLLILYTALSQIVAPIAGTPGNIVALSVYGFWGGWVLHFIGALISASLNFFIARYLGRNWVIKLAGKKSISKIDKFVDVMGTRLLIMARIFGFPLFDYISYAVGFTNMSFKKYFLITAFTSLFTGTLVMYLLYNSLSSAFFLTIVLGSFTLIGILFAWYMVWLYQKQLQE